MLDRCLCDRRRVVVLLGREQTLDDTWRAETVHDFLIFGLSDQEFHASCVELFGEFAGIDVLDDILCNEFIVDEHGAEDELFELLQGDKGAA